MSDSKSDVSRRKIFAGAGIAVGTLAVSGLAAKAARDAGAVGDLAAKAASNGGIDATLLGQLQAMLDKQAVAEVMMTYCRALDHMDEALLRSVFHPDSKHHHGFKGPSSSSDGTPDFVAYALGVLRTYHRSHHHLGNIFVEIDGDVAFTEAYFTAYQRARAKSDPLAGAGAFDTEMDRIVAGRYLDRMEKRDGVWKITHRTGLTDWQRIEAPFSKGMDDIPPELRGHQNKDDLIYHRRERYQPA